jgi:heavy metal sensor kinase
MKFNHLSIRWRLTLWNALAFALILIAFGLVVFALLRDAHFKMLDKALDQRADSLVESLNSSAPADQAADQWISSFAKQGEYLLILRDSKPSTRLATEGLATQDIERVMTAVAGARVGTFADVQLGRYRYLSRELSLQGQPHRLYVLAELEHLDEELALVRATFLWAIPPALFVSAALSYWLAVRALSPVEQLRKRTDAITATDLHLRIPVANEQDEIGQLTQTVNALFARLEHAFEEIKRFSADASHELRTPIAIIRSEAEMCLQQAPQDRTADRLKSIIEECTRVADLTSQLLQLSRAESNLSLTTAETFALNKLLVDIVDSFQPLAITSQVIVEFAESKCDCSIRGNREAMRQVFHNLIDNAIKYNVPDGKVELSCYRENQEVVVEVRDTGRGIAHEDLPRVFERFFRGGKQAEGPRIFGANASHQGTGLGLSIVKRIVANHGGLCQIESRSGAGTLVRIRLPSK